MSTTATYYIMSAAGDVREAMIKLENEIKEPTQTRTDTNRTVNAAPGPISTMVQ